MSTIKLERHEKWSTYGGPDPYPSWKIDPVEAEGYDERLAFPYLKPDLDVLPPSLKRGLTRRQRGWYQIIQACRGPDNLSSQRQQHRFATGADLPTELLPVITEWISTSSCDKPDKKVRKAGRHRIGLYASVCRDWAERFHAELFYSCIISSRVVVIELLTLLRSPAGRGRLRRHMKCFMLCYDPSDPPWLHLMPTVYAFLSEAPITELSITGPFATPCPRSLHAKLPRSLPAFSSAISELSFTAVHFLRFDDLARLQCSLPHLRRLHGSELTWDTPPTLVTSCFHVPETSLEYIQLRECSTIWPAVRLIMLCRHLARLSDEDCDLLGALAQAIEGADGTFTSCRCRLSVLEDDSEDRCGFSFELRHKDKATLTFRVSVLAQRQARDAVFEGPIPAGTHCLSIVRAQISYKNKKRTRKWIPIRWDAVDQVLASFKYLERVTLVFKRYFEGSQEYADEAVAMMPHISRSGKLHLTWKNATHKTVFEEW